MSELQFVMGGRVVKASEMPRELLPLPRKTSGLRRVRDPSKATHSFGFVALGYPPGTLDRIGAAHKEKVASWLGYGEPPSLEKFTASWLRDYKPKRIRPSPYESREAAELCAGLAEKEGWLHTRVGELLKAAA